MSAFQATFANFRPVATRKVYQIILEVPIEQANAALDVLGGVPDPANPAWVAVARLSQAKAEEPKQIEAPKRKWEELSPSQQSGIRCNDPDFQRFMRERKPALRNTIALRTQGEPQITAELVRHACGVVSRAELDTEKHGPIRWAELNDEFFKWQRGMR